MPKHTDTNKPQTDALFSRYFKKSTNDLIELQRVKSVSKQAEWDR